MLDLGFAETMNAILSNLPITRQTMLFSATQTKSVKDLARLSLKNPTYVSVHEHAAFSTPKNLIQTYVTCESHEKLSFLWSFIRNHLNQKIIVFFQSCKQVNFHRFRIIQSNNNYFNKRQREQQRSSLSMRHLAECKRA